MTNNFITNVVFFGDAELLKINLQRTVVIKEHAQYTGKQKKQQSRGKTTQIICLTFQSIDLAAHINAAQLRLNSDKHPAQRCLKIFTPS